MCTRTYYIIAEVQEYNSKNFPINYTRGLHFSLLTTPKKSHCIDRNINYNLIYELSVYTVQCACTTFR